MTRAALLLALAACWTAPPVESPPVAMRRHLTPRHKPTCWSPEFHEAWPDPPDFSECYQGDQDWTFCAMETYRLAYDRLRIWTDHWFEACDPKR